MTAIPPTTATVLTRRVPCYAVLLTVQGMGGDALTPTQGIPVSAFLYRLKSLLALMCTAHAVVTLHLIENVATYSVATSRRYLTNYCDLKYRVNQL
jgi:hypothetical protein